MRVALLRVLNGTPDVIVRDTERTRLTDCMRQLLIFTRIKARFIISSAGLHYTVQVTLVKTRTRHEGSDLLLLIDFPAYEFFDVWVV